MPPTNMHVHDLSCIAQDPLPIPTFLRCGSSLWREGLKHVLAGTCFQVHEDESDDALSLAQFSGADSILVIAEATQNPSELAGMIRDLKAQWSAARIVVLGDKPDLNLIVQAFEAGAAGVLPTTTGIAILVKSLELIMLGEVVFPTALILNGLRHAPHLPEQGHQLGATGATMPALSGDASGLSEREQEILRLLTEGAPNKVIARTLGVAEATVKVHIKSILRKIRAQNRTQAAMWATAHLHSAPYGRYGQ
jgi:two-component system, NarL family, nitrate/nitrite response regulator NarL